MKACPLTKANPAYFPAAVTRSVMHTVLIQQQMTARQNKAAACSFEYHKRQLIPEADQRAGNRGAGRK